MAFKLLAAVTGTGAGTAVPVLNIPTSYGIQVTFTGSPSTVTVALEGSLNNTNFFVLDSSTYGTTGDIVFVVDKTVRYMRANLTTLSGGSSPTVTVLVEANPD